LASSSTGVVTSSFRNPAAQAFTLAADLGLSWTNSPMLLPKLPRHHGHRGGVADDEGDRSADHAEPPGERRNQEEKGAGADQPRGQRRIRPVERVEHRR